MTHESSPYLLRQLTPEDEPQLRALLSVFAEAFDQRETYLAAQPSEAYLQTLLRDECFIAVVATTGSEVVGGLFAYELRKPEQERSEIYIYDLAVAEAHRRRGIATALIEKTREIGRSRGAWVVFLQADVGDDGPIALYSQLGAREDVVQFDIEVT